MNKHTALFSPPWSVLTLEGTVFGNGIQEAVHDSAAAIVVRYMEKGDEPTVAINGTMNYYPPSKSTQINNYLVEHNTCIRQQQQNLRRGMCFDVLQQRCVTSILTYFCSHVDLC